MNGAKTHGARFAGGIERASGQIDGFEFLTSIPDGMDFRMSRNIERMPNDIMVAADHLIFVNDTGAKRCLAFTDTGLSLTNC